MAQEGLAWMCATTCRRLSTLVAERLGAAHRLMRARNNSSPDWGWASPYLRRSRRGRLFQLGRCSR
eukprot:4362394-Pyramimonas_sp.AAC.1